MRLLTRSDFDGLACAILLVDAGIVDEYKFVHPKDLQDGLVEVTPNDVLANVPYVPGCGLWFDHHTSERERLGILEKHAYEGSSKIVPSCARVIYDYYGGAATFAKFDANGMMNAVDHCDSGQLSIQDVLHPEGWVLLSYLMDPRTGLGYHKDYRVSNYTLMADLIQYCRTMPLERILELPDVKERIDRYHAQEKNYEAMLRRCGHVEGNVLVLQLLDEPELAPGNRFKEYALWPEQNISLRIFWGLRRENVVFSLGHSILNRSSQTNVGELMLRYGGGGHTRVGTRQVAIDQWKRVRNELIDAIREDAPDPEFGPASGEAAGSAF